MTDTLPPHPHLPIAQLMEVARSALSPQRLAYLMELERACAHLPPRKVPPPPTGPEGEVRRAARAIRRLCKQRPEFHGVLMLLEAALEVLKEARNGARPEWAAARAEEGQVVLWEAK